MSERTAYLAAEGYVDELAHELGAVERRHGRLLIASGPPRTAAWAANVWLDPCAIKIVSISDAAAKLRAIQRNWAVYAPELHRRATLIQERLPKVSAKPLVFGAPTPAALLGSWTLLECRPAPGETCLDLGGSPGGWSWVLQQIGARVISVDKAPLAPEIARLPRIEHRLESAFALDPRAVGPVDWLLSDVVCYPARLLTLVERWLAAGVCGRFICTIKFQGETDHETARRFAAIPGSQLRHLFNNKNELTWIKIG